MPKRSTVRLLPGDVRRAVMRKLRENGFSNYGGLSRELRQAGYAISRSALYRFGVKLEAAVKSAEIDELVKHNAPDRETSILSGLAAVPDAEDRGP